jgi:hypothetical protein
MIFITPGFTRIGFPSPPPDGCPNIAVSLSRNVVHELTRILGAAFGFYSHSTLAEKLTVRFSERGTRNSERGNGAGFIAFSGNLMPLREKGTKPMCLPRKAEMQ